MCNAIMIGMLFAIGIEMGMATNPGFWILYFAALVTNTRWFRQKEEKWLKQPAEGE